MSITFTPKEQFIVASVRMITDEHAKKLPREARQTMLNYIRDRLGVTKEEWNEVALNIDLTMRNITEILEADYTKSDDKLIEDTVLMKMEREIRDGLKDIDLDKYQTDNPEHSKMIDDVKEKKKRFGFI